MYVEEQALHCHTLVGALTSHLGRKSTIDRLCKAPEDAVRLLFVCSKQS